MKALTTTIAASTGHPAYSQVLPCAAQSAGEARRLVLAACGAWGLDELAESGTLLVSELVGNAVRHTRCQLVRVEVARVGRDRVRISVTDRSAALPVRRDPGDGATCGRGLLILDALADRWGTDPLAYGKRVWAELVRQPPAP
ncbi:ATP-binding protein [Streptomyces sp. IBSBF 2435]|uniref:ATP-binding protein n=1 Tax=Streptomyces sp. IBSBF 2435 TaxID=2903531 RepID=UPI002FDC64D2